MLERESEENLVPTVVDFQERLKQVDDGSMVLEANTNQPQSSSHPLSTAGDPLEKNHVRHSIRFLTYRPYRLG